jgi:hypothetical protein
MIGNDIDSVGVSRTRVYMPDENASNGNTAFILPGSVNPDAIGYLTPIGE